MKKVCTVFVVLCLAACSSAGKLSEAKRINPQGTEFQKTLYSEYVAMAEKEQAAGDYEDTAFYVDRALISGAGKRIEPYSVDENGLPTSTVPMFKKARTRLNDAFSSGARKQTPYKAAKAQAAYDCWLEEVSDNNGMTKRAEVCRDRFRANISEIEEMIQ